MKTVPPINKRCRICNRKKLLVDFEIDDDNKDRHTNICKECLTGEALCVGCVENKIIDTAEPMVEMLIDLVKDGMSCPPRLVHKINSLAILAGAKIYCEGCNERLK
jgi:hypothetical protein